MPSARFLLPDNRRITVVLTAAELAGFHEFDLCEARISTLP
jgi:hypothetical protein